MKAITKGLSALAVVLALGGIAHAAQEQRGWGGPSANVTETRAEAQAKAEAMFDRMDLNKDGKLDQADRAAMMAKKFDEIDTDHNGSISRDEFAAAHQRMEKGGHEGHDGGDRMAMRGEGRGHRSGHGEMGGMMSHMADANKDGTVTRQEFVAGALKRFDAADTNKDGKVTPEERKAAFAKMRTMMKSMRGGPGGDMPPPPPPAN
ncbi:MAG: EF-hand domain-containing protein [Proteobacteria bacterium]|nr:EF-hand domain-containing protein [Pseudomonadota bacterium]